MAATESMFVFEVAVEELKSFSHATNYQIRARFGSVFTLQLKDPNQLIAEAILPRRGGKKSRGLKLRHGRIVPKTLIVPSSQTAVVVSDAESLIQSMLRYPIEITHYSKDEPFVLGVAEIPWTVPYINYLRELGEKPDLLPVVSRETYKTYDEYTSKRVAVIRLKLQLSQLKDNLALTTKIRSKPVNECDPSAHNFDNIAVETGKIKTIYSGGIRIKDYSHKKNAIDVKYSLTQTTKDNLLEKTYNKTDDSPQTSNLQECNVIVKNEVDDKTVDVISQPVKDFDESADSSKHSIPRITKNKNSIVNLVRSQSHIDNTNLFAMTKHWSSTSVEIKERLDTLHYIFGNLDGPFGNRIYCVGYFTVKNDRSEARGSEKASPVDTPGKTPPDTPGKTPTDTPTSTPGHTTPEKTPTVTPGTSPTVSPRKSPTDTPRKSSKESPEKNLEAQKSASNLYSFNICDKKCIFGTPKNPCFENICNLDLPEASHYNISMSKCEHVSCDFRRQAASLSDPNTDEIPLLVEFGNSRKTKDCCVKKVEEVVGGMSAKLINDPCLCTCECTFGFIKKTTYCSICGGVEVPGDEMKSTRGGAPFPCPVYHGLVKGKKGSKKTSASGDEGDIMIQSKQEKKKPKSIKSVESDKESVKKRKKRRKDPRFKFNYGYKGIPPQIGHSQCAMPCTGDMYPVPKHMGWLWTANNIPGLKVRPNWRPGAANKHVVRMLRVARFPEEVLSKRKKKDTGKKKRPLKRPLLIVQKKDGEYHVSMETMKTFTKPRAVNQYPYEDKPLVQYTVGRTDEENAERKKRKERAQRRLEREQRAFLQSAFHDMCKDICLKTYQQALGMVPFADDSFCPCYPDDPPPDRIDLSHSCSCTESTRSSGSMTDDDEWVIEFTPPNAYFNSTRVIKKVHLVDNSSQYNYLDYRVKILDKFGSPVPRFFIGPDGTQQCSDLGGFWGPDKTWLEINVDGFVGPDARWAPNFFIGPCGEPVDAETGKFQSTNNVWLTVGVDGYVDTKGKWRFYPKPKVASKDPKKQRNVEAWIKAGGCVKDGEPKSKRKRNKFGVLDHGNHSEATWSCFGDASPRTLSQMGIAGHGHDRRLLLSTLEQLMKQGEDVKIPQRPDIPKVPGKRKSKKPGEMHGRVYSERMKCKHHKPDSKNIMAVNDRGHKTYFHLMDPKNPRPKQRIKALGEKGISLSSFHVPCFSSFINSEMARKQQVEHILQHNARVFESGVQTQ